MRDPPAPDCFHTATSRSTAPGESTYAAMLPFDQPAMSLPLYWVQVAPLSCEYQSSAFVDVDAQPEIAEAFQVRGIPALFLMKDGE